MNKPFDIPSLRFQAESKQMTKRTAATEFYCDFECHGDGFGKPEHETATVKCEEPN